MNERSLVCEAAKNARHCPRSQGDAAATCACINSQQIVRMNMKDGLTWEKCRL